MANGRQNSDSSGYTLETLPIVGQYNIQRFKQFGPEDSANFYITPGENTVSNACLYPTFGRKHINFNGINQLIFPTEPRAVFKTVNFWYAIAGRIIYKVDRNYSREDINPGTKRLATLSGNIWFDFLITPDRTFACFVDSEFIYVYIEETDTFEKITDTLAPGNNGSKPGFIASFGNRIVVSNAESPSFFLSQINLGGDAFDPAMCFHVADQAVFAQEEGIIRQFAVLSNTLYIMTDYFTGIWSNIPSNLGNAYFPWKKSSAYNWNYGIADPLSLDVGYDRITFLAKNKAGILQVMSTVNGQPERISSKAIDVLFQRYTDDPQTNNPFLEGNANGFLFNYENTIFYRISAGQYNDDQLLDLTQTSNCIEYNFETKTWHRVIELNGQRNRCQRHVFFNNQHLVTVQDEATIYQLSGAYYTNEMRNLDVSDPQDISAYIEEPFRYIRTTPILTFGEYIEFETDYIEIFFVWGENTVNFQELSDPTFIPHLELYYSDDGQNFHPADVREFSSLGQYLWRMRWYQLGCSRMRVYRLIGVSRVPIVILSGAMNVRRVSGGSN